MIHLSSYHKSQGLTLGHIQVLKIMNLIPLPNVVNEIGKFIFIEKEIFQSYSLHHE